MDILADIVAIMAFSPAPVVARGYYQGLLVRNARTRPVGIGALAT